MVACGSIYYKRQCLCRSLFLIKLKIFPRNSNDRVCDGFCNRIYFSFKGVTESGLSKASGISCNHKTFNVNGSDGVCF